MKTNTKQFPEHQLFDLEVLEQTKKGLEKNDFPSPSIYSEWRRSISTQFSLHIPCVVLYDLCEQGCEEWDALLNSH